MTHCSQCDGKGFIELRDCSGEIQREETCSFCNGTGLNTAISKLDLTNRDRGLIETYLHRLQWDDIRKRSPLLDSKAEKDFARMGKILV